MDLSDYLRILRKRGWIAIVVAAVAAISAFGFSKLQTPVYSASMKLSVNPARADWGWATRPRISCATMRRTFTHTRWPRKSSIEPNSIWTPPPCWAS